MAWKFLKFWRKSTGINRKIHDYPDFTNDFDWTLISQQPACKTLVVWTKIEENFENFQENLNNSD